MSGTTPSPFEISEVDFGDDDIAFTVELPIPPFGLAIFSSEDASAESRGALQAVCDAWRQLWPDVLDRLEAGIVDFELPRKLDAAEFTALVTEVAEDDPMAGRSDLLVSLEFDEAPHWDFYLRGSKIVHSQPVFSEQENL